jgi:hypothetical protein
MLAITIDFVTRILTHAETAVAAIPKRIPSRIASVISNHAGNTERRPTMARSSELRSWQLQSNIA